MFSRIVRAVIGRPSGKGITRGRQASRYLETLESRTLLDGIGVGPGNATVAFARGKLTITGDDYDNVIAITVSGSNLVVTGTGTTINSPGVSFTEPLAQITGDVKIQMRGGSDRVSITGWTVPKNLTIDMGEGDNVTVISTSTISGGLNFTAAAGDDVWQLTSCTVAKNFKTVSGEGDDTTEIQNTIFNAGVSIRGGFGYDSIDFKDSVILGNAAIANGDGGSQVTFEKDSGSSRIAGNLSVTSLVGSDYLTIDNARIDGKIDADFGHGSGDHGLLLNNSSVARNITLKSIDGMGLYDFNNAHVAGNIRITSRFEEGSALFRKGTTVAGNITLAASVTPMGLQITGAAIHGNVSLTNGAGSAYMNIDSSTAPTTISGKLTIQSGSGNNTLNVDHADISGAVKVTLGSGDNAINFLDGAAFAGTLDLKVAGGRTNLTIDTVTFSGRVTINTGAGHDTLLIDDSTFNVAVTINTGAGDDQLKVDTAKAADGPITWFKQALTANLGTGSDILMLGDGNAGNIVRFGAPSKIDMGGGIDGKFTWLDGTIVPTILSAEFTVNIQ